MDEINNNNSNNNNTDNNIPYKFNDQITSDIIINLTSKDNNKSESFHCHSFILINNSKYFSDIFSNPNLDKNKPVKLNCTRSEFEHYIKLLNLLYIPKDSILEKLDSVKSTIGILKSAIFLNCDLVQLNCINYLESVPWDENEEEEILKLVPNLNLKPEFAQILNRIKPVSSNSCKNVFISAIKFATTCNSDQIEGLNSKNEIKISAQEQVEYMLLEDEETSLIIIDQDIKSEIKTGLNKLFQNFKNYLNSPELDEQSLLTLLNDLDWIFNVVQKIEMAQNFISNWAEISSQTVTLIHNPNSKPSLEINQKILEITTKSFDLIGYGSITLPVPVKIHFIKTWLPFIREIKPLLETNLLFESEMWENLEGAISSFVLALPSNEQADILSEWVGLSDQVNYPDLSEAFEVWCFRTKSAKRRLVNGSQNGNVNF